MIRENEVRGGNDGEINKGRRDMQTSRRTYKRIKAGESERQTKKGTTKGLANAIKKMQMQLGSYLISSKGDNS